MHLVNAKRLVGPTAAILIAAVSGTVLAAQDRPPSANTFCIRGDRLRECRSFAIVEVPIGANLASTRHSESNGLGDSYIGFEIGGMANRDDSHAIGASIAGGVFAGEWHLSANARSRTWFSGKSYRDVSAGVVALGSSEFSTAYGLTARVGFGSLDLIGVWAGTDVGLIGGPPRASIHAGVRLGSYAALGLTGLAGAVLASGWPFVAQ